MIQLIFQVLLFEIYLQKHFSYILKIIYNLIAILILLKNLMLVLQLIPMKLSHAVIIVLGNEI